MHALGVQALLSEFAVHVQLLEQVQAVLRPDGVVLNQLQQSWVVNPDWEVDPLVDDNANNDSEGDTKGAILSQQQQLFQSIVKCVTHAVRDAVSTDDEELISTTVDDANQAMDFIDFNSRALNEQLEMCVCALGVC